MKEILLDNGFLDTGLCPVCSGQAWKYVKSINNRTVEVKVFGSYQNTLNGRAWKERGDAIIKIGQSATKVTQVSYLQTTLEHLRLATVTA